MEGAGLVTAAIAIYGVYIFSVVDDIAGLYGDEVHMIPYVDKANEYFALARDAFEKIIEQAGYAY